MSTMATRYTHSTAWWSSLRQWLFLMAPAQQSIESEQAQAFQHAFHCAYRRFAQRYPEWVGRRFDDEFLRQAMNPAFAGQTATIAIAQMNGHQLAWAWAHQFGPLLPEVVRTRQVVELIEVANHFLYLLRAEHAK